MKAIVCGLFAAVLLQLSSAAYNYDLKDGTKVCLFARFEGYLSVSYTLKNNSQSTQQINLDDQLASDGMCAGNKTTAELELKAGPKTLRFTFKQQKNQTVLDSMSFSFVLDKAEFPDAKEQGKNSSAHGTIDWPLAPAHNYYRCDALHEAHLKDGPSQVTVTLKDAVFQVFDIENNQMSANKTECIQDATTTTHSTAHHTTHNSTHNATTHHTTHHTTNNHTTATTAPMTTTVPSLPSEPMVGSWNYSVNGSVCVMLKAGVRLTISYSNKQNKSVSKKFDVPTDAVVNSALSVCNTSLNRIVLSFFGKQWQLTLQLEKDKSKAYVDQLVLDYALDKQRFPNASNDKPQSANATGLELFKASSDNYFQCDSKEEQKLGDKVTLDFYELKVQGFRDDKKSDFTGTAEECSADEKTSALVPIVVGAALAALVVIVLIAYLIGRRRRQSGYQSV